MSYSIKKKILILVGEAKRGTGNESVTPFAAHLCHTVPVQLPIARDQQNKKNPGETKLHSSITNSNQLSDTQYGNYLCGTVLQELLSLSFSHTTSASTVGVEHPLTKPPDPLHSSTRVSRDCVPPRPLLTISSGNVMALLFIYRYPIPSYEKMHVNISGFALNSLTVINIRGNCVPVLRTL